MGKRGNSEGFAPTSHGERETPAHVNATRQPGQVINTAGLTIAERIRLARGIVNTDPSVISDLWALCRVNPQISTNADAAQLDSFPISKGA